MAVVRLVAVLSKLLLGLVIHLCVLLRLCQVPPRCLLSLVVCSPFDFSSLFQPVRSILAKSIRSSHSPMLCHTFQPRPCISSQLRGSIFRRCSISSPALDVVLSTLVVRPCAFSCRMVVGHPRKPLDAPLLRHRGRSCEGSCRGRSCRKYGRGRGSGRGLEVEGSAELIIT